MYQYLKAIGFKQCNTKKKLKELTDYVVNYYDRKNSYDISEEEILYIYEKDFSEATGMAVMMICDHSQYSEVDAVFPYVRGVNYLFHDNLEFERHTGNQQLSCICDENNLGIPLIFHVNNIVEYLKRTHSIFQEEFNCMTLAGISSGGMIILPIEKDEYQIKRERQGNEIRNQMIDAAKAGDVDAMEQLTLEDMDTYTLVNNRSKKEDIFTIVTSYFMPYTVECDKYSVLGNIINVSTMTNKKTGEDFYYISLECNSIQIDFVAAKEDITGMPEIGRRFKGHIWLQGEVDCM